MDGSLIIKRTEKRLQRAKKIPNNFFKEIEQRLGDILNHIFQALQKIKSTISSTVSVISHSFSILTWAFPVHFLSK